MNTLMKALVAGSLVISLAMAKNPIAATQDSVRTTGKIEEEEIDRIKEPQADKVKMDKAARAALRDSAKTLKRTDRNQGRRADRGSQGGQLSPQA